MAYLGRQNHGMFCLWQVQVPYLAQAEVLGGAELQVQDSLAVESFPPPPTRQYSSLRT